MQTQITNTNMDANTDKDTDTNTYAKTVLQIQIQVEIQIEIQIQTRHSWQMAPMLLPRYSVASQGTSCLPEGDILLQLKFDLLSV